MGMLPNFAATRWSVSKHDPACWRRWYFQYVLNWGGWEHDAPDRIRAAYRLTKLQGRFAWAGNEVHRSIARVLAHFRDTGTQLPLEEVLGEAHGRFEAARRASVANAALFLTSPKKHWRFEEDYFPRRHKKNIWLDTWRTIEQAVTGFYAEDIWGRIVSIPTANWLMIDPRAVDDEGSGSRKKWSSPEFGLELPGRGRKRPTVTVQALMDFAYRDPKDDTMIRIPDWKSGLPSPASDSKNLFQRGVYGALARRQWGASGPKITSTTVFLRIPDAKERSQTSTFTDASLDEVEAAVVTSSLAIRSRFTDPENAVADEEAFPCIEDKSACEWCPFREICPGAPQQFRTALAVIRKRK